MFWIALVASNRRILKKQINQKTDDMSAKMRIYTAIEKSTQAAIHWRNQYENWDDDDKFADGTTKGGTNDALNSNSHTPENITRILNAGWAKPSCKCCGEYVDVVVQLSEDWGDDTTELCEGCIKQAALMLGQLTR